MLTKYKYIIFTVLLSLFYNTESKGQCIDADFDIPNCIIINTPTSFINNSIINTSCSITWNWLIYDDSWNYLGYSGSTNLNYTFNSTGNYIIVLDPTINGSPPACCAPNPPIINSNTLTITVVNNPVNLSLSTNSTTVCANGSIDYPSLGINITNATGNVTYTWNTSPTNISWSGLITNPIPAGENSVTLTVTDDSTGCTDIKTISLTYQSTNASASFVSSVNTVSCPGESVIFTANNINTSLYSYSWMIDGVLQSGGVNGILTSNILPNVSNVDITLFVEDDNNGCIVQTTNSLNVNIPDYVALDTSGTNFDSQKNYFSYCFQTDSVIVDTLFNLFTNTTGIDTVIIDNGFTQEIHTSIQGFDEFYVNISENVYNITVTTIYSGNCPPTTITYDVLFTSLLSFNTSFGQQSIYDICKGDTVNYFIDPQVFEMPLNAETFYDYSLCFINMLRFDVSHFSRK